MKDFSLEMEANILSHNVVVPLNSYIGTNPIKINQIATIAGIRKRRLRKILSLQKRPSLLEIVSITSALGIKPKIELYKHEPDTPKQSEEQPSPPN